MRTAYWISYGVFMCFFFYLDSIGQYNNSEKTTGVVVDQLIGAKGRINSTATYPQIKFDYKDSSYLFGQRHGYFLWRFHNGDRVTVIFPKNDPGKAAIYSFLGYWIPLIKLLVSFMIAVAIFMLAIHPVWGIILKR